MASQYDNQYDIYKRNQKLNSKRRASANDSHKIIQCEMVGGAGNGFAMPAAILTENYPPRPKRK